MALSWTARKQISYFSVLVVIGMGLLFAFYRSVTGPSCTDGVKNQDEEATDCGGVCGECIGDARGLIIQWVKPFKLRERAYEVLVVIDNPNITLGASGVPYTIKLFDDRGILVAAREGSTFVNPAETFGVLETNIATGSRMPTRALIELSDSVNWKRVEDNPPRLAVPRKEYVTDPFPRLDATVENKELAPVGAVSAIGILYDASGSALAVSGTTIQSLAAGEAQDISFSWPDGVTGNVATSEVLIRVDITRK